MLKTPFFIRLSYVFVLSFFMFTIQVKSQNCTDILKNNTFRYTSGRQNVKIEFTEDEYIEHHNDKDKYVKAAVKWVDDCKYVLVVKEVTLPNVPYKPGEKLEVIVKEIKKEKIVYFKAVFKDKEWDGTMIRVKESAKKNTIYGKGKGE